MGEVMPLTPEDVSNKRFTPVRLREGYDMGEVDQFLDEVEAELARLTKENDELRSRLTEAHLAVPAEPAPAAVAPPAPATPEHRAPEVAAPEPVAEPKPADATSGGGIQTLRVETVAEASNAAARLLELATRNHDELIDQAKNDADRIVGEARAKAERQEAESKATADKMESDARQRAQMLDSETAQRREQLFGDLEKERDKLTTEVENLRAFEREYRSRLKTYFTQQLESLNSSVESSAAPSGSSEGAPAPKRLRSILGEEES
jgi:DivIVA domain-containing protein